MPLRYTFRQLEYLVAVGDAGTIAVASERVNVSSPSISAAISQLEAEFGVQIFVRHHAQGLSLTPGGRRIYNEARRILEDAAALNDLAKEISDKPRGSLAVGVLNTVAPLISAAIRRSFEDEYPDATVRLHEGHQVELFDMLGRAEIDVALTYDMEIPKEVAFEDLLALPPYAMVAADHPLAEQSSVSLEQLASDPMVLLDLPISREYFLSVFRACEVRPNIRERSFDMSVVRSLVANGYGFSLVNMRTKSEMAPDGKSLAFLKLTNKIPSLVLGFATKQIEHRSKIVDAFYKHLQVRISTDGLPGVSFYDEA
ncbi:MAG: LysR substrate-binding domain-containing protein [Pseudomonadota bacterium]